LEKSAGNVLRDAGEQSTFEDVVRLLKSRFGSQNQAERLRLELKACHKKKESMQALHQDVRRLIAQAFPNQSGSMCEIMARDAFLEALGDSNMRIRVLEKEPPTLDEVLTIAMRLEALGIGNAGPAGFDWA
jgi:hypothetical protein